MSHVSVRDFGAKGDGTDDTDAFLKAIEASACRDAPSPDGDGPQ